MHISEGLLAPQVWVGGSVLAACAVTYSLKKLPWERLMSVGVLAAAFFVASLIHVKIGPGSVHLILNGLLGALLGWSCLPAMAVALFLQAVLFHFGGLTTLGVNICVMGFPAVLCGLLLRPWLRSSPRVTLCAAFVCGALSVALSAGLFALALCLSGSAFIPIVLPVLLAHIPIMLIEGLLTAVIVGFLSRVLPEMLLFAMRDSYEF